MGRPSEFSQEIADSICDRLTDGQSLRKICCDDDMPAASTVFRWLTARPEFQEQYAHAREAQADALFDEILDIADDGTNDWVADKEEAEGFRYNGDAVQRSKLRVEARKWMAGKLQPKKYSDRQIVDMTHGLSEEAAEWLGLKPPS
jgi:succinate dehydrogenase flavin-adding protein (antitoxin of CptAB toxin-antitoxin module)